MKKRLASLLLATVFVFVAGAAFAAWDSTTSVPDGGDLIFSTISCNFGSGTGVRSGDLKASGFTGKDNPFSFGVRINDNKVKRFGFGVTEVVNGDYIQGAGGVSLGGSAFNNTLVLRLPVAGSASTTHIPVVFFGNTSQDEAASFDIYFKNTGDDSSKVSLSFAEATGVTSSDAGFGVGTLTVKISRDFYGQLAIKEATLDTTLSKDFTEPGYACFENLHIFALKNRPSVRITYKYGDSGNSKTKTIIKDLEPGTTTVNIPTIVESFEVSSVDITKVENIGNIGLKAADDYLKDGNFIGPAGAKFFAGAAVDGLNVELKSQDSKLLFDGSPYSVEVTWDGSYREGFSAGMMSGDVDDFVNDKKADFGLAGFEVKSTDLDGEKLGGKNIRFPEHALTSMDFTSSADLTDKARYTDLLAAVGFNLTASSRDFNASFDSGKDILMVKVDVEFLVKGADATKNNKPFTSAEWIDMFDAADNGSRRDLFLGKVKIFKASEGSSDPQNIAKVLEGGGLEPGGFISVEKSGDHDVKVKVKNLFLADGGDAGLKVETIDGKKVLVFYDSVADGKFIDPIGIAGELVKPVTPVDPVKPDDPAGPVKKTVTINTGVHRIYIGDEIPGNEVSGVEFTLTRLGDVASSNKGQTVYGPYEVKNGTFSVPEIPSGRYSLQLSELKGYITPAPIEFSTSGAVNGLVAVLSKNISYVEGGYLTLSVKDATENASFDGEVKFTLKDKDEKEVSILVGENALPRGDYTITATTTDVAFTVALDKASFTIDDDENYKVAVKATVNAAGGSSSGGGCNVGFAPLALLLLAPVMFLKK